MSQMSYEQVSAAIEEGGSIRKAAILLGMSYTAVQWWIARNGYRIEQSARLVPVQFELTQKGREVVKVTEKGE